MCGRARTRRFIGGPVLVLGALLSSGCGAPANAAPRPASPLIPTATAAAAPTASVAPVPAPTLTPEATRTVIATASTSTVRVLFVGDINPGRCPAALALAADDFTLPYRDVGAVLQEADLTVGSLDGALSDVSPPAACTPEREYNLIGPTRTIEGLAFAGFDLLSVATNHAQDCGSSGFVCDGRVLADTLRTLRAADIAPVGAGEDLDAARQTVIVERNGLRLAFLAVSAVGDFAWADADRPGTAPLSESTLPDVLADIRAARASTDAVVVLVHWGIEYDPMPTPDQRRWAERMIAAGATLVVGNHPHVIQPIEPEGAGLVAYALGNFVFDQDPDATRHGLVLEATFSTAGLADWRTLPIEIVDLYRPEWR